MGIVFSGAQSPGAHQRFVSGSPSKHRAASWPSDEGVQSLELGRCLAHFRDSTTVVLRKPGKEDYTVPKAYRSIALLNTSVRLISNVLPYRRPFYGQIKNGH